MDTNSLKLYCQKRRREGGGNKQKSRLAERMGEYVARSTIDDMLDILQGEGGA